MAACSAPGRLAWPLCGPPIQEGWVSWGLRTSLRHRLKDACSTGFCPGRCPALRDLLLEWLLEFGGAEPKPCAIAYFPESWDLRGGRQRRGRQTYDSVVTALDVGPTGTLVGRTVGGQRGGREAGRRGGLVQAAGRAAFSTWCLDCWVPEPEEPSGHHSIWKRDRRR